MSSSKNLQEDIILESEDEVPDQDEDGYPLDEDCDDTNPDIHPDVIELCDGLDNDCDGEVDEGLLTSFYGDEDGDGFGNVDKILESCEEPDGFVENSMDGDDDNDEIHPEYG